MTDYKCPNCGASFSLPLGMTCDDHHPEPIIEEEIDPEDLPHVQEIMDDPEGWILANLVDDPDEELATELQFAAILIMGLQLTAMGMDPDDVAEDLASKAVRIHLGPEGLELDFYEEEDSDGQD